MNTGRLEKCRIFTILPSIAGLFLQISPPERHPEPKLIKAPKISGVKHTVSTSNTQLPKNSTQTHKAAPAGYSTVCPYLIVASVEKQIEFLKEVFRAEVKGDYISQTDQYITHGEVRIGDTVVMIGRGNSQYPNRVGMNYVYVENADEVYKRAIQCGAASVMEPVDQVYGDRSGGFIDPQGNEWWVGQRLK